MAWTDGDDRGIQVNITPLIDCVFLLLIFFMVTTVFSTSVGLRIELPTAEHWRKIPEHKLNLSIARDGKMDLNGKVVTKETLPGVLIAEKAKARSTTLIIKADKDSIHEYTLDAMEIAKEMGIDRISVATEKKEEQEVSSR